MSSSSDEEDYDIYNTKKVCSSFNEQLERLKAQFKNRNNPKAAPVKENHAQSKNLPQSKNDISNKIKDIEGTSKETNNTNNQSSDEENKSDSEDSILSAGEKEDEDRSCENNDAGRIQHHSNNFMEQLLEEPPAQSTRSRQKTLITPNQTSITNSPVRKKKRGPLDKYLNRNNNPKTKFDSKEEEIILIDDECEDKSREKEEEEDELNYEVSVKVIWKTTKVRKFTLRKFQKFSKLFEQFMKEENVSADKIILTLHGQKVKPTDTPDSLNLKVYDFIDGGVLSDSTNNLRNDAEEEKVDDDDDSMVSVKFQDKDKKIIKLKLKKTDKMKVVMLKYKEQIDDGKIQIDKIKFLFDGEVLDPSETPITLGLDNDEVIDVKF